MDYELRELTLSLPFIRQRVETFLARNGLRLDDVDYYVGLFDADDELVGGGGLKGSVIKCLAVDESLRGEGLMARIVSLLLSEAASHGEQTTMVFTKPENELLFANLGYHLLARAPEAILMESSLTRLGTFLVGISKHLRSDALTRGIIVMNANPFTLGHLYLVEEASYQVEELIVMVVSEDVSDFPFAERLEMVRLGTERIGNVVVCETGPYAISAATFPTYFLKDLNAAAETQMRLDLDLFSRYIAPVLGITKRFVGTEPNDALTRRYNELMHILLEDITVVELPRMRFEASTIKSKDFTLRLQPYISASLVREGAWRQVPYTSRPYLIAHYACCALQEELDLTPKPGLVDRADSGAHADMDYALMQRSIAALRPYFAEIMDSPMPEGFAIHFLRQIGLRAEAAMFAATQGVNTHKGALFSLGLTIAAVKYLGYIWWSDEEVPDHYLSWGISHLADQYPEPRGTHGAALRERYGVGGALAEARAGFPVAFAAARFPAKNEHERFLFILSRLEDSNVVHRCGLEVAREVRAQAAHLLKTGFTLDDLRRLNADYTARNISPGGAADIYALSRFLSRLLHP